MAQSSESCSTFSTGSDALDKMIHDGEASGKTTDNDIRNGIRKGNVILIRGEPGSGKTTLALQILSNFQKENDGSKALFLTYEETVQSLFCDNSRFIKDTFFRDYTLKEKEKKKGYPVYNLENQLASKTDIGPTILQCIPAKTFVKYIKNSYSEKANIIALLIRLLRFFFRPSPSDISAETVEQAFRAIQDVLATRKKINNATQASGLQKSVNADIIVLDSLNAFLNLVQQQFPNLQPRRLLSRLCLILKEEFGNGNDTTIILTGEHHYHAENLDKSIRESFICDIEIILRPELVRVPVSYEPSIQAPLGYNLNALIGPDATDIESRSFCRVLKSRGSNNQSRRCAYDIVAGIGLHFYETYPGDGKIVLFSENKKQREEWESFFRIDMPESYPALRYKVFNRHHMQTVYQGQRRLRNMPLKTDMYIGSFDSYWVNLYRDFKLKTELDSLFRSIDLNIEEKTYSKFINHLVYRLNEEINNENRKLPTEQDRIISITIETLDSNNIFSPMKDQLLERRSKSSITNDRDGLAETLLDRLFSEKNIRGMTFLKNYSSFLYPLEMKKLKLFGERRANIIPELLKSRTSLNEKMIEGLMSSGGIASNRDEVQYRLSIPYDANISFFVVKSSLYNELVKKLDENELKEEVRKRLSLDQDSDSRKNQMANRLVNYRVKELLKGDYPRTWEEMMAVASLTNRNILLETQTFDSYMCTVLEIIWNSGAEDFNIDAQYNIENADKMEAAFCRSFKLLDSLFSSGIVDHSSTLETNFKNFKSPRNKLNSNWLFARHWYSTLVDSLTAKDDEGKFIWKGDWSKSSPRLDIIPIPISLSYWLERLVAKKGNSPSIDDLLSVEPPSHSTWGEWSLGVLSGSENTALAIDIINNFMSSGKICDRAFSGACLPTVDKFYEMYGSLPCLNLNDSTDIELPQITFSELRKNYFENAKTRLDIYDYRHIARIIHSKVEKIRLRNRDVDHSAEPISGNEIMNIVNEMFAEIASLVECPILLSTIERSIDS